LEGLGKYPSPNPNPNFRPLQAAGSVEVLESLLDTSLHRFFSLSHPNPGIVLLLVWLVRAFGVAYLTLWGRYLVSNLAVKDREREVAYLQVLDIVEDVVTDSSQVAPLEIGIDIDLDDAMGNGLAILVLGRSRATVEDEEDWLGVRATQLLGDELLVFAEELGVQLHVSGRVLEIELASRQERNITASKGHSVLTDSMNIAKAGSDGEVFGDGTERRLDRPDVLRLCVQRSVVDGRVVNTILCY